MRIGVSLLNNCGIGDGHALVDLASRAEELGVDSVWTHDHVFNVAHVLERIGNRPYYEPLALLVFLAALRGQPRAAMSCACGPIAPVRLIHFPPTSTAFSSLPCSFHSDASLASDDGYHDVILPSPASR